VCSNGTTFLPPVGDDIDPSALLLSDAVFSALGACVSVGINPDQYRHDAVGRALARARLRA
jgi:hypothetical protein